MTYAILATDHKSAWAAAIRWDDYDCNLAYKVLDVSICLLEELQASSTQSVSVDTLHTSGTTLPVRYVDKVCP